MYKPAPRPSISFAGIFWVFGKIGNARNRRGPEAPGGKSTTKGGKKWAKMRLLSSSFPSFQPGKTGEGFPVIGAIVAHAKGAAGKMIVLHIHQGLG